MYKESQYNDNHKAQNKLLSTNKPKAIMELEVLLNLVVPVGLFGEFWGEGWGRGQAFQLLEYQMVRVVGQI